MYSCNAGSNSENTFVVFSDGINLNIIMMSFLSNAVKFSEISWGDKFENSDFTVFH